MPTSLDSIFFAGPYLLCWSHRSGVRCWLPLSVVPRQLPASSFLQPTLFRVPLPLPDTARFQVQKSFVWFRAKTDKGIVWLLHRHTLWHTRIFNQLYSDLHNVFGNVSFLCTWYLSLSPTRQDLTQGQWPEGRLKWEFRWGKGRERAKAWALLDFAAMWAWWASPDMDLNLGPGTNAWL